MFRSLAPSSSRTLRTARLPIRPFSLSAQTAVDNRSTNSSQTDQTSDDKHAVNKAQQSEAHDFQSANVKAGMDADKAGAGGNATAGRDDQGGKAKAKREFPEAPDVAIGMQDERGGKGG